jgi:hypothetical protein
MLRSPVTPARRHRLLVAAGAALAALVLPAHAGAMTATAPVHDAVATSHPVFHWTLTPGEQTDTIKISDSPATTPAGDFLAEHLVDMDIFFDGTTAWSPTSPLAAGTDWWNVTGHDADYHDVRTLPEAFHVAPVIAGQKLSLTTFGRYSRDMMMAAVWRTNARNVLVTFKVTRKGRTIWRRSVHGGTSGSMTDDAGSATWTNNRRKAKRGQKVRVTMTISYGGRVVTASRTVKAP